MIQREDNGGFPAWTGGITTPAQAGAPGFKSGGHHPDPYAADKPLYKIDASNMSRYAANLTAGHKALLSAYKGSYFINVYPSHRSAAFPQRIYDATKANATTAKLTGGGFTNRGEDARADDAADAEEGDVAPTECAFEGVL